MSIKVAPFLGMALFFATFSCKTTTKSQEKSIPIEDITHISRDEWVLACQKELEKPVEGPKSKEELILLANTSDCNLAYPVVKDLVDSFIQK